MTPSGAGRRIPRYFLYGEAPRRITGPLLHVEAIESRSARHHWKIAPHVHEVLHQLIFVARGTGVTRADSVRVQYRPPALILIPAGTVHAFEFEPGTSGHVISVSDQLRRDMAQRESGIASLFSRPLILELRRDALRATDLALSVRMLAREFACHESGHGLALDGWLQVMLGNALRLVQKHGDPADSTVGQQRLLLERFFGVVERRFRSSQSVQTYADTLHTSPSRLRRACVRFAGQSPMQLIHARILLEAKRQLHYTDNAISTIATDLGFEDAAYFTRFFSRRVGIAPRLFRKQVPGSVSLSSPDNS
jgi:AraC family transcriptional activator of pobA